MAKAKHSAFTNQQVKVVSDFIQDYLLMNNLSTISADEAAKELAENGILTNKVGPKPGFNFRQMLRDGRDGLIDKVAGVYQERPRTKWIINRI